MTDFQCGKWQGDPPKGQMTPRKSIGWITNNTGIKWEVLCWQIDNKSPAAQIHIRDDFSIGFKIFFSTEKDTRVWLSKPVDPTIEEIEAALNECQWHKPSRGRLQLWVNFQRM